MRVWLDWLLEPTDAVRIDVFRRSAALCLAGYYALSFARLLSGARPLWFDLVWPELLFGLCGPSIIPFKILCAGGGLCWLIVAAGILPRGLSVVGGVTALLFHRGIASVGDIDDYVVASVAFWVALLSISEKLTAKHARRGLGNQQVGWVPGLTRKVLLVWLAAMVVYAPFWELGLRGLLPGFVLRILSGVTVALLFLPQGVVASRIASGAVAVLALVLWQKQGPAIAALGLAAASTLVWARAARSESVGGFKESPAHHVLDSCAVLAIWMVLLFVSTFGFMPAPSENFASAILSDVGLRPELRWIGTSNEEWSVETERAPGFGRRLYPTLETPADRRDAAVWSYLSDGPWDRRGGALLAMRRWQIGGALKARFCRPSEDGNRELLIVRHASKQARIVARVPCDRSNSRG